MDTGQGKFATIDFHKTEQEVDRLNKMRSLEEKYPLHGGWFREGEIIEIRGSTFRISSVKPTQLRLKLLKRGS